MIRFTCYRLRVRSHVRLSRIQIACVLHLSLLGFNRNGHRGCTVVRCDESRKKIASDPVSKTAAVAAASKNMVHQNLVWRQLIISLTIQCHGNSAMWPPCYLRGFLSATVGMSAMWGVPVPNCSLLLCLVFIGECIGKVIKWLRQKYITEASNLTERLNSSSR